VTRRLILIILTLLIAAVSGSACGSRSHQLANNQPQPNGPSAPSAPVDAANKAVRTQLVTSLPALQGLPAGSEFEFTLSGSFTEPVFQGSARLLYDSSVVQPVSATAGKVLPSGAVVLARTDAHPGVLAISSNDRPANMDGCVPFAFTGRPGGASITPGGGELLRVRFRLKIAKPGSIPVRLQNDPEFLQLRNSQGQRVAFDLEREVAAR
jgi:hypothetical protein